MSDTSGPTSALPSMRYDLASSSWRTCEATSLWDLEMSSPTFPEWGMTRGGELFPLVRPEPPTGELASSLLPTPISRDVKEQTLGWTWQRDGVTQEDTLPRALTALLPDQIAALLPTPTVMDMGANYTPEEWDAWKARQRAAHQNGNGHGASLTQEAISLLPTPRAQLGEHQHPWVRPLDQPQNLENAVARIGASTPQPSTDGSASSDEPHPAPPSPARPDDPDCLPLSWNG